VEYNWPTTYPNWSTLTINSVSLPTGTTSITISKEWGYFYIDYVTLTLTGSPTSPPGSITVADHPDTFLQGPTYAYGTAWLGDGVWAPSGLTRGTYTGPSGTQYEQHIGISSSLGSHGALTGRLTWGWPQVDPSSPSYSEIKTYPAILYGKKPGIMNTWITPGGWPVILPNGTQSQTYPSGPTPGTTFPYPVDSTFPNLYTSFSYTHNQTPTGRGHLSYDLWLQNTPVQQHGWNSANEITHEIMIPVSYWGGYGSYGTRNRDWYDHDVVIGGNLYHVYVSKNSDGTFVAPSAWFPWKFCVFEPDTASSPATTLNLKLFIDHLKSRTDSAGNLWVSGSEYLVSSELGVEVEYGTGDVTWSNGVWK
jgi:hypothetical protein